MRQVILLALLLAVAVPCLAYSRRQPANSSLIMLYHGKGHTWGKLNAAEFDMALIELSQQRSTATEGDLPTCGGLVDELCIPCPDGGPEGFCQSMIDECSKIFCTPMCKRTTWTCKIDFGGFEAEGAEQERYEDALCAHFINEGCSTILDCCPRDDFLRQDVEDKVWRDNYPNPALPTPSCIHDPAGPAGPGLCDKCNSDVKVELEKKECPFPPTPKGFLEISSSVTASASAGASAAKPAKRQPYGEKLSLEELYERDEALLAEIESTHAARERRVAASLLEVSAVTKTETETESEAEADKRIPVRASAGLGGKMAAELLTQMLGGGSSSIATKTYQADQRAAAKVAATSLVEGQSGADVEAEAEAEVSDEGDGENENPNEREFGDAVPGFPGASTYKGLNDRCNKLVERVEGMFGDMTSQFQEKVCNCMGCCIAEGEPVCFFPMYEVIASAPGEEKVEAFLEMGSSVQVSGHAGSAPLLRRFAAERQQGRFQKRLRVRQQRRESRWAKHWAKVRAEREAAAAAGAN